MLKVGLTGNIGSGKTIVARIFNQLGVPVFYADAEARKLFDDENVKSDIRELFGSTVFSQSGVIVKSAIAKIVFSDAEKLEKLNKIIHPAVRERYRLWCQGNSESIYSLYEAAILFESGHYMEMDKVICVTAPEDLRVRRVMERDNLTANEVKMRMANQWSEDKKVELADFVIRNNETSSVIRQVLEVHKVLAKSRPITNNQ
jgi:dephospho-CoA kinase